MYRFNLINKNRLLLLIFFVFASFLLVSCQSSKKKAVATIDGKAISSAYFLTTTSPRFQQKSLDDRQQELEDFYQTVLRAHDAKAQDLHLKPELKYKIFAAQRTIKNQQLYQAYVVDKVITEDMIKEAYNNMDERRTIRHILFTDSTSVSSTSDRSPEQAKELAREIKGKIEAGELTFEEAANEYSEGPSSRKGGELGTISWGQMVQPFQKAAWALQPNTISDPVETDFGFHLIEVTGVDTVDLGTFEESRERIVRSLQRSKQSEIRKRSSEALEEIQESTGFSQNDEALDSVATQMFQRYQMAERNGESTYLLDIAADIHYAPVGTLDGEPIDIGKFKEMLKYIQNNNFKGIPNKGYLVRRISSELQQEYIRLFAENYGISDYKDTQYKLRWAEDKALDDYYVKNIVLKDFPPSPDSLRAYFDRVKFDKYSNPADVHVQEIYFTDKQTAEDVRSQLDNDADFGALAAQYTERPSAKADNGDLGWFESNRYGPIGQQARSMDIGSIEGPFQVGTGWSIIKLIDRDKGEVLNFDDIRRQVQQDYTDYYRPRRLEQNILKLEEKYNSEVYYSVVQDL